MRFLFIRLVSAVALLAAVLLLTECRDNTIVTDPSVSISFSTDTLTFDTVFTTVGSITRSFRIFNNHKNTIRISKIDLAGLSGQQFRLNIDGIPGRNFTDVEVPGKDSIWVFVEVTVDPMDQDLPFVMEDRIDFLTNGNQQTLALMAWGQDANFIFGEDELTTQSWNADRPYVIVGNSNFPGVHVDTNQTLTIMPGARIFMHRNAGIFVSGTLKIMGTQTDSVVFEGDRLENFFDDLPAQWLGIFFLRGSTNNEIEYATINEGDFGISAGSSFSSDLTTFTNATRPDVVVRHSVIKNIQNNAVFGFNADIRMENCLVFNTNDHLLTIGLGGAYRFYNCTFFNAGSVVIDHKASNLLLSNAAETPDLLVVNDLEQADFINCIMYGSLDEELALSEVDGGDFNFNFENCMLKTQGDTLPGFTNNLVNLDPQFVSSFEENFRLDENSPAIDAGKVPPITLVDDLDGNIRPVGAGFDIGAYEFQ